MYNVNVQIQQQITLKKATYRKYGG